MPHIHCAPLLPSVSAPLPPLVSATKLLPDKTKRWLEWSKKIARTLDPSLLHNEPGLLDKKLLRYRSLTPAAANLEFAQEYVKAFRYEFGRTVDIEQAESTKALDLTVFYLLGSEDKSGVRQGVHLNRQRADERGLPYGPFIAFCFRFFRMYARRRLPRPNQLYSSKYSAAWQREFETFLKNEYASSLRRDADDHAGPHSTTPGCLGILGAHDPASSICAACPQFRACAFWCRQVEHMLNADAAAGGKPTSFAERKLAQTRAKTRDRVTRFRARHKSKALAKAVASAAEATYAKS